MNIIGKRLKQLRQAAGLSQEDMSQKLGISRIAYLKYENGENRPIRRLTELSKIFNVSIDYIMGQSSTKSIMKGVNTSCLNKNISGIRLKALREEKGLSQEEVAKLIGVGRTTYVKYESGDSRPVRKLDELTRLFNVSSDYIMGLSAKRSPQSKTNTSQDASLPPLTPKDERDITRDLENMLASLDGAAPMGDAEDEEDLEMLKASLETAMRLSKRIAKKKFTPKKYRKE